jgi:hypothetical protein
MNEPKLIDVNPFPPLIIKSHYDGFDFKKLEPICESLIKETKIKTHLEDGMAASSAPNQKRQPHAMKEFSDFYKWLEPIAQHIMKTEWQLFDGFQYIISNSWVNVHGKGGKTITHHHGATVLTIAAYIQLPENGGYLEIRDPNEYEKGFHMTQIDDDVLNWREVKATTGDVVIFPGWLRHRTQENNSEINRWVLTTNYMSIKSAKW